jgi:hypothetical protein
MVFVLQNFLYLGPHPLHYESAAKAEIEAYMEPQMVRSILYFWI